MASLLQDTIGFDANGLANSWVAYQTAKNQAKAAGAQSTIDQLKQTVDVYASTNQQLYDMAMQKKQGNALGSLGMENFDVKSLLPYALFAGAAFFAYRLLK